MVEQTNNQSLPETSDTSETPGVNIKVFSHSLVFSNPRPVRQDSLVARHVAKESATIDKKIPQ